MFHISFNDDPDLFKNIITGDESWVCSYDIESKAQSFQWKHPEQPRPVKCRLLTVFCAMPWGITGKVKK